MRARKFALANARFMLFLAVFSPGLVAVLGYGVMINALYLVACAFPALGVLQMWSAGNRKNFYYRPTLAFYLGGAVILLQLISMTRGVLSPFPEVNEISYRLLLLGIMAIGAVFFFQNLKPLEMAPALNHALVMVALFCAVNLVFWAMGMRSPQADSNLAANAKAVILSYMGIDMLRVYFPLSWGVNTFGSTSAAVFAAGLIRMLTARKYRVRALTPLNLLLTIPTFVCILLTDSRGAFAAAIVSAFVGAYFPRLAGPAIVAFLTISFLAVFNLGSLSSMNIPGLSRDDGSSVLSGRELIWAPVVLEAVNPTSDHVFGWGHFGHFSSGVSKVYGVVLAGWGDTPELIHVHSTYLQSFVDTGYVGTVALVLFIVVGISTLSRIIREMDSVDSRISLALLTFFSMQGFSEITFQCYQPWLFLFLLTIIAPMRRKIFVRREAQAQSDGNVPRRMVIDGG